jgi:hypothetical protein
VLFRSPAITSDDFESLWKAFTSSEASAYAFQPSPSDSMSDVRFYTVKLVGPKQQISLRIPREKQPEAISSAISKIKAWIDEKS